MSVTLAASLIDPITLEPIPASFERIELFQALTGLDYDPPIRTDSTDVITITCPCCTPRTTYSVPWCMPGGGGYAQPSFSPRCVKTQLVFNREMMGVRRLCDEIATVVSGNREKIYFA